MKNRIISLLSILFLSSSSLILNLTFPEIANAREPVCPSSVIGDSSQLANIPNVKSIRFISQTLQRVDPTTLDISLNPKGVIGCYKYFSTSTGNDALWDIGVVTYENSKFEWVNAAGVRWNLDPNFGTLRFKTDKTNPYFGNEQAQYFILYTAFKPEDSCIIPNKTNYGINGPFDQLSNRKIASVQSPKILAVLIDFNERLGTTTKNEYERFDLKQVEEFYKYNSYGKSKLSIEVMEKVIYIDGSVNDYQKSETHLALFAKIISQLKTQVNLDSYSGYIFTSPAAGPRLNAGYETNTEIGPLVWMGGINPKTDGWVELWKMLAHEIGHMYGLPDLYFTQYGNLNLEGNSVGPFDLMDGIAGISNSLNFNHRWILGWLTESQVICRLPTEEPYTLELTPISENDNGVKGVILPLSETTAILVEVRVKTKFDTLTPDQEGVLVYFLDTKKPSGQGPLRLVPSKNEWTQKPGLIDDVIRFQEGALALGERVTDSGIFVEYTKRNSNNFTITITKGESYFITKDFERKVASEKAAAELKAKQEAEAKAAAEKLAAELKAKQEADAKIAADKAAADKIIADAKAAADKIAVELKAKQEFDSRVAAEKIIADAKAEADRILAAAKAAAAKKKKTITCVKGKVTKKVTAVKPVCPKGYKKK
jgi:M6 family metalloprotease-like protein